MNIARERYPGGESEILLGLAHLLATISPIASPDFSITTTASLFHVPYKSADNEVCYYPFGPAGRCHRSGGHGTAYGSPQRDAMGRHSEETGSWNVDDLVGCAQLLIEVVRFADCCVGKGGKVTDPAGAVSKKQVLESPSKVAGVKRVKMRYGPYSVPNMNKTSITGEAGALWLVFLIPIGR